MKQYVSRHHPIADGDAEYAVESIAKMTAYGQEQNGEQSQDGPQAASPLKSEERYFRFQYPGKEISRITKIVSIDNVKDGWVYAYANDRAWERFSRLGYTIETLPHPGSLNTELCAPSSRELARWDKYPSHTAYLEMMNNFQKNYPELCEVSSIGKSTNGRALMVAKLTSKASKSANKPKLFYSASMHGDETTGYVLMLRLIDHLLTSYSKSTPDGIRATNILDNMEIWINPLANPDGTYRDSDTSIKNPTRGNAAGVDLNRNYPDPKGTDHPDGENWQPETIAMMQLANQNRFVLASNMHGGAEVANYPWDTWSARHVDDAWWQAVCRRYADNVHASSPSGYFRDLNDGVTNGFDWYEVNGSRQDYTNFKFGCREMTLELSASKFLPGSKLPAHWDYNKNALLSYMEESLKGIRGTVTDAKTGSPLTATVSLNATNEMPVTSDSKTGAFFRVVLPGTYAITVKSDGYEAKTISDISINDSTATVLEVKLQPHHPIADGDAEYAVESIAKIKLEDQVKKLLALADMDPGLYDAMKEVIRQRAVPEPKPSGDDFAQMLAISYAKDYNFVLPAGARPVRAFVLPAGEPPSQSERKVCTADGCRGCMYDCYHVDCPPEKPCSGCEYDCSGKVYTQRRDPPNR